MTIPTRRVPDVTENAVAPALQSTALGAGGRHMLARMLDDYRGSRY